jgi:hypothetical protein
VLPKGLKDAESGRILSIEEIEGRGLWTANTTEHYRQENVDIEDCDADTIAKFAEQVMIHFQESCGKKVDSRVSHKVQAFFASASNVPIELKGKVPTISELWLNYDKT